MLFDNTYARLEKKTLSLVSAERDLVEANNKRKRAEEDVTFQKVEITKLEQKHKEEHRAMEEKHDELRSAPP
jgi:hypothetical protein